MTSIDDITESIEAQPAGCSRSNWRNIFYTVLILFNNFILGMNGQLYSSTLVDLNYIYSGDLLKIPIASGIGNIMGPIASVLFFRLNRQLCLGVSVMAYAALMGAFPHYGYIEWALGATVASSFILGVYHSLMYIWLVDMWLKNVAPMLHGAAFVSGLGNMLTPQIVRPFLFGNHNMTTDLNGTQRPIQISDRVHSLTIPFLAINLLQIIVPSIFIISYFVCKYDQFGLSEQNSELNNQSDIAHENMRNDDSDKSVNGQPLPEDADRSTIHNRTCFLSMIILCATCFNAADSGSNFMPTMYQYMDPSDGERLSLSTVSNVQTASSAASSIGRLMTAFISTKVTPNIILTYHYGFIAVAVAMLYFGRDHLALIFVGNILLGFGGCAIMSGIFAFTEHNQRLTLRIFSIFRFCIGISHLVMPLCISKSTIQNDPLFLFRLMAPLFTASFVFFVLTLIWISIQAAKSPEEMPPSQPNEPVTEQYRQQQLTQLPARELPARQHSEYATYRRFTIIGPNAAIHVVDARKRSSTHRLRQSMSVD